MWVSDTNLQSVPVTTFNPVPELKAACIEIKGFENTLPTKKRPVFGALPFSFYEILNKLLSLLQLKRHIPFRNHLAGKSDAILQILLL